MTGLDERNVGWIFFFFFLSFCYAASAALYYIAFSQHYLAVSLGSVAFHHFGAKEESDGWIRGFFLSIFFE